MNQFLWDENANQDVLRAWSERDPGRDILTVHGAGLSESSDAEILEWAAAHHRVVVTQDRNTMPGIAAERLRAGRFMAGVIVLDLTKLSPGGAADELTVLAGVSLPGELFNRIVFLPL